MLNYIKIYCKIPASIVAYDDQLNELRLMAIALLEKNGIDPDETSALVRSFISGYCRLYIADEPAEQWRNSELKRLDSLQSLLYYGGV